MESNRDFNDLLRAFIDGSVAFLVVGAHAPAVHDRPRATKDLDVWIDATPENAQRAWDALGIFGAPLDHLTVADLTGDDTIDESLARAAGALFVARYRVPRASLGAGRP